MPRSIMSMPANPKGGVAFASAISRIVGLCFQSASRSSTELAAPVANTICAPSQALARASKSGAAMAPTSMPKAAFK